MRYLLPLLLLGACTDYDLVGDGDEPIVPEDTDEPTGGEEAIPEDVPRGALQGHVCEDASGGLEGATVTLEHPWGVARTATDAEGYFLLEGLPVGEYVVEVTAGAFRRTLPVTVVEAETATIETAECLELCEFAIPCMGLSEAMDRGIAEVFASGGGDITISNLSDEHSICLDEWLVVTSDVSQDATIGQDPGTRLAPGQYRVFPPALDVFGGESDRAWWCVEHFQGMTRGARYDYNGSLAPRLVFDWIHDRTDTNGNFVEDHADDLDYTPIAQWNIWNTQEAQPIVMVGRERDLHRLVDAEDRVRVTVQAWNLGQQPAVTSVTEVVPAGFIVSQVSPAARIVDLGEDGTSLTWEVELEAAESLTGAQAIYDIRDLSYTLERDLDQPCEGRCVGRGAVGTFIDLVGETWQSRSEPLIIEVCELPED